MKWALVVLITLILFLFITPLPIYYAFLSGYTLSHLRPNISSNPDSCAAYSPLFDENSHVHRDLTAWGNSTVTVAALDAFDRDAAQNYPRYTARVAIVGGKVYLRRKLPRPITPEGARLAAFLADIVDVAEQNDIADSEFFLNMADDPFVYRDTEQQPLLPVFSHCKNENYGDFVIPGFDFRCGGQHSFDNLYKWRFNTTTSTTTMSGDSSSSIETGSKEEEEEENAAAAAWERRQSIAFGRWTMFCESSALAFPDKTDTPCARAYLDVYNAEHPGKKSIDVGSINDESLTKDHLERLLEIAPTQDEVKVTNAVLVLRYKIDGFPAFKAPKSFVPLREQFENYRYLVITDGWSCSLKLEKFMLSGAAILKQESAARGFYYHLLSPGVNYQPFYKHPDDLVDEVKWLRENDDRAKAMGAAAVGIGKKYLHAEARRCYWRALLNGLGERMGFQPECGSGSRRCVPAREELEDVAEAAMEADCDVRPYTATNGVRPSK